MVIINKIIPKKPKFQIKLRTLAFYNYIKSKIGILRFCERIFGFMELALKSCKSC